MLQISFFSNFKGRADVILFWGDAAELREINDVLSELISAGKGHHFSTRNVEIDLELSHKSRGMQRRDGLSFLWEVDTSDAAWFRDLVKTLVEANEPGHQYLECAVPGEIAVMVSRGEYPPSLRNRPPPKAT